MLQIKRALEGLVDDGFVSEEFWEKINEFVKMTDKLLKKIDKTEEDIDIEEVAAKLYIEEIAEKLEEIRKEYLDNKTGETKRIEIANRDNSAERILYSVDKGATQELLWEFFNLLESIAPHDRKEDWYEFVDTMFRAVFPDAEEEYGDEEYFV